MGAKVRDYPGSTPALSVLPYKPRIPCPAVRAVKTLPHVSVWVHWAAVFLWRRWVRDDGSSHPAEP